MTGYLTQTLGEWMVRHEKDDKLYPLCPETKKWSEKSEVKRYLKENIEVVFDFIINGEYCETKQEMIKNYFVKIKRIEHESI